MKITMLLAASMMAALPFAADAQGFNEGARSGARTGSGVAGPVGGVVGGAIGAGVGAAEGGVRGVLGVPQRHYGRGSRRRAYRRRK